MYNILSDRFKECYNITSKVIDKYNKLYMVMNTYSFEDSSIYECYIVDVLELVLKEYNIYSKLSLSDINSCLKLIKNVDCDESKIDERFKRKLEILRDTCMGIKINGNQIEIDNIPNNIDFNLFVCLTSLIDIEMMKKVKQKLDNISVDNYKDLMFLKELYTNFNNTLFFQTYGNNLTEIICLSNNMNIDSISNGSIKKLIKLLNDNFNIDNDSYFKPVDLTLLQLAKISVNRLACEDIDNEADTIFNNLAFIVRLEVLINYMNKNCLIEFLNYCENVISTNKFGMDNAIKLIRERIK